MIKSHLQATRTEVAADGGVVTGGHPLEAEAGLRMLQQGGNAIDAVVAAAFTGFVVEPASCGLGGYGRMAIYLGGRREFVTIDHRIRAPLRSRPDMFDLDDDGGSLYFGHPRTAGRRAEWGHLAVAVPGAVSGLFTAHEAFGRLPWPQLLEPAIEAAQAGLPVAWDLALHVAARLEQIRALPAAAGLLLRRGDAPISADEDGPGDRLDQSDLAHTLKLIAGGGASAFYGGRIASAIERELADHGGILAADDLAAYRPRVVREAPRRYRGYDYITADDPVSYEALNILDGFDLSAHGPDSALFRHLVAEAFGIAFADNMAHYGDPEFTASPARGLASRDFAAQRANLVRTDRALDRPIAPADPWPFEPEATRPAGATPPPTTAELRGTSQMAAADRDGNLVTLITTLESAFGSLVVVPGTGILLNNSMSNFDPRPGHPNCIQPGKMPIFGVPTLVAAQNGKAVFGACGSGGYRILTGVLHAMLYSLDFGMGAQAAVEGLRVHCQGHETFVDSRLRPEVQAALQALGHEVVPQAEHPGATNFGRVNAIQIDPATGVMRTGTGPAWTTAAAGF